MRIGFLLIPFVLENARCLKKGDDGVCENTKYEKPDEQYFCCQGFTEVNDICKVCDECNRKDNCPDEKCGDSCKLSCVCSNRQICDPWYCCICQPGFTGTYCNESCIPEKFGFNCMMTCTCLDTERCDPISGNCTIDSGETRYNESTSQSTSESPETNSTLFIFIVATSGGTFTFILLTVLIHRCRKKRDMLHQTETIVHKTVTI